MKVVINDIGSKLGINQTHLYKPKPNLKKDLQSEDGICINN